MLDYQEVIQQTQAPRPDYYEFLLENAKVLVDEVKMYSQAHVALDLNISRPKFTAIHAMLVAYLILHPTKV